MGNILIGIIFTVALIVVVYLLGHRAPEEEEEDPELLRRIQLER